MLAKYAEHGSYDALNFFKISSKRLFTQPSHLSPPIPRWGDVPKAVRTSDWDTNTRNLLQRSNDIDAEIEGEKHLDKLFKNHVRNMHVNPLSARGLTPHEFPSEIGEIVKTKTRIPGMQGYLHATPQDLIDLGVAHPRTRLISDSKHLPAETIQGLQDWGMIGTRMDPLRRFGYGQAAHGKNLITGLRNIGTSGAGRIIGSSLKGLAPTLGTLGTLSALGLAHHFMSDNDRDG